jgi:hypothetical protein
MGCAQLSWGIAQERDPRRVAALRADKITYYILYEVARSGAARRSESESTYEGARSGATNMGVVVG